MTCGCDFDDVADVWCETRRKAYKAHRCRECHETIEPGDEYVSISFLWEGHWFREPICEFCDHDWGVLAKLGYTKLLGGLEEYWRQAWGGA